MPYRDDPFVKPVEVTTIKVKLPWYRFGIPYKDKLIQNVKMQQSNGAVITPHYFTIEYCRKWEVVYDRGRCFQYQLMDGSFILVTLISVDDDSNYSGATGWVEVWRGLDFGKYSGPYAYGCARHLRVGLKPEPGDLSTFTLEFGNLSKTFAVDLAGKRVKHSNYDVAKLPSLPFEKVSPSFRDVALEKAIEYSKRAVEQDKERVKAEVARVKEEARQAREAGKKAREEGRKIREEARRHRAAEKERWEKLAGQSPKKKRKVPEYEKAFVRVAEDLAKVGGLSNYVGSDISVSEHEVVITKNGKTTIIRNGEVIREDE